MWKLKLEIQKGKIVSHRFSTGCGKPVETIVVVELFPLAGIPF
jgi:hypothetical protein